MIDTLVADCMDRERQRGLAESTLKDLNRYLHEFAAYCHTKINSIEELSADFLRQYVQVRGHDQGPDLVKAVVWSLRKFGAFLVLRDIVAVNPAKPLRHPHIVSRRQLPEYLTAEQLRRLLHHGNHRLCRRDFAVLSLICSTGMRPSSVAALQRSHFIAAQHYVIEEVSYGPPAFQACKELNDKPAR